MDLFGYFYLGFFIFGITLTIANILLRPERTAGSQSDTGPVIAGIIGAIIWFGAGGFIGVLAGAENFWSLPGALISAVIAYFVANFMVERLQNTTTKLPDEELRGQIARVSRPISPEQAGEVVFIREGSAHAYPARTAEKCSFNTDDQIVIINCENGVALVDNLGKILKDASAEKWMTS
jgi:membrane protein implicated in regulation of membrane protease activity